MDAMCRSGKTPNGNRWLRQALVEMTDAAAKTKGTYLVERRLVTRLEPLGSVVENDPKLVCDLVEIMINRDPS
jgi:hypothetical protein